jgi:hypothetical protein
MGMSIYRLSVAAGYRLQGNAGYGMRNAGCFAALPPADIFRPFGAYIRFDAFTQGGAHVVRLPWAIIGRALRAFASCGFVSPAVLAHRRDRFVFS